MSTPTGGANSPLFPDETHYPNAEVQALAAEFEAACQAEREFHHGGGTDAESDAAILDVREVVHKIVALPGKDISILRLKARAYMHLEGEDLGQHDSVSGPVLASLFRDLLGDVEASR
jgi:hypothetical protein